MPLKFLNKIFIKVLVVFAIFLISSLLTSRKVLSDTCGSCWGYSCCTECQGGYGPTTTCGVTCPCCPSSATVFMMTCTTDYGQTYVDCCGGSCFTGETEVDIKSQDLNFKNQKIAELKPGDLVSSFNPETGEMSEGTVSDIKKRTVEGYYVLETEGGKKVKVTAEHPFLAVKGENAQIPNSKFQIVDKFKKILSNTLTYNLIASLQAKINAALK